jgi:hypothetical protein
VDDQSAFDPQETQNLAAPHQEVFNELAAALRAHVQRGGATPWQKTAGPILFPSQTGASQ